MKNILQFEDFEFTKILGYGTLSKIYLANAKDNQYAVKVLRKDA